MATKKIKAAVFTAEIAAPSGKQPALVIVTVPEGCKTWQSAVISFAEKSSGGYDWREAEVLKCSSQTLRNSSALSTILGGGNMTINYDSFDKPFDDKDVTLTGKIDAAIVDDYHIDPAGLLESDYSNSGSTLEVYIKNKYTVGQGVDDSSTKAVARKIVYPKDEVDWDKTWNSPFITDEEKKTMEYPVDLDIAMSNSSRDCRQIMEKIMTTKYYCKNFTLIGLHGNPGGGKTKMVLNDYCALNHIPVVAIPCDPMMVITQILSQVGPVAQKPMVSAADVGPMVSDLKNQLFLINNAMEGADENTLSTLRDQASKIVDTLNKVSLISKDCADLVKTPSILMKCLEHNLPLVVFLDEGNIASTTFQNSLAPIISDGIYKDGPKVGRNDHTIKWIMAWNPATSNSKSFDGKFFDRMSFIQVEDVSKEQRIGYRVRKTLHGMYDQASDYGESDAMIDEAKAGDPENGEAYEAVRSKIHGIDASKDALNWYTGELLSKVGGNGQIAFAPKRFTKAYLGDVALDSASKAEEATRKIDDLVLSINQELFALTKGKDTKNPDRNSFFKITDRNLDFFSDLIFSYSDVGKAVHRYIFDLIPGGNTLRTIGAKDNSLDDQTPGIIATSICDKLDGDIIKLNNFLFTDISDQDKLSAAKAIEGAVYRDDLWISTATQAADEANGAEAGPDAEAFDAPQSDDICIDADDLLG